MSEKKAPNSEYHHPDCNYWKWDWRYCYDNTDCNCDDVGAATDVAQLAEDAATLQRLKTFATERGFDSITDAIVAASNAHE